MDDDRLRRIAESREEGQQESARRYLQDSHDRLRRNMETKIRTTMIGALSLLEEKFGFLWGQGKPGDQLTDRELTMGELKDELRTEILNNGNNQLRAAVSELGQYEVKWNRHQLNFPMENL